MTVLELLILCLLIIVLVGGAPPFHLHPYGYAPSGLALLVILVLIVWIARRRPL